MKNTNEELDMNIKRVCPCCESLTNQELVKKTEEYKVRNELILAESSFYVCSVCENEIEDDSVTDPLVEVYRKYRDIKGYIHPHQLVEFRQKYDLTQKELSHMLGFGAVTLSRYENGSLQTDSHNISLEMAMQPNSLKMLVERNIPIFSKDKLEALLTSLEKECENLYCGSSNEISRQLSKSKINEFSGYSELQVLKLIELIIFMCSFGGTLKTKLNKLLFYSDFYAFKESTRSMTGLQYVHLPYGPVPDNFDFVYAQLIKEGVLCKEEISYPNGYFGENYVSNRDVDLTMFNENEKSILELVQAKFQNYSSKEITDYSHEEMAYKETVLSEVISYKFSEDLSDLQ